jgi:hypothetical protein
MTMAARTNYIQHLNAFFAKVRKDDRLHANHISLYLALFQIWNQYRFRSPFPILREEVIRLCHIGSLNTYTKCLKDLHTLGYVIYQPAPQRGAPSLICVNSLNRAQSANETVQLSLFEDFVFPQSHTFSSLLDLFVKQCTAEPPYLKNDTGASSRKNETALNRESATSSISKLRHFNNKHVNGKKREGKNRSSPSKKNISNEAKNKAKPVSPGAAGQPATPATPSLYQVQEFFQAAGYPDQEGRKFFYHYQGNGWRQGSGLPLTDWQAAAHKWMLNNKPYKTESNDKRHTKSATQPGGLHTNEDKSYSDPL